MGEMKSAWEIAQARAARLGKLSAEEQRQHQEKEARQIGTAIAQRYLGHWNPEDMQDEVSRYSTEQKPAITRAILAELAETITLTGQSMFERTAEGIVRLEPQARGTIDRIRELSSEYGQAESKTRQEIEAGAKQMLHQLRISGSAVGGINVEASQEWQQSMREMAQPYQERLEELKSELLRA